MSDKIGNAIQNQLSEIVSLLEKNNLEGNTEGLFSKYVLSKKDQTKLDWNVNCSSKWVEENTQTISQGNYTNLASLGFSLHLDSQGNQKPIFKEGFKQLMQREPFLGDRVSFPFFPRLFLGIVLGLQTLGEEKNANLSWLKEIYKKRSEMGDFDSTQKLQYSIVENMLDEKQTHVDHSIVESLTKLEEFCIVYWGYKNGIFLFHSPEKTYSLIEKEIFSRFALQNIESYDESLLAFVYYSVSNIVLDTTIASLMSVNHVSKILQNFESAMKRWVFNENKKWVIDNEKDVQSILYLILRSVFEDTQYEEPTDKFGHGWSIVDLKIPSLKLLIEVKFVRQSSDFSKIEDEIKIDSVDYVKSTDYKKIVVVIYSPPV